MKHSVVLVMTRFAARTRRQPVGVRPASIEVASRDRDRNRALLDEGAEDILRAKRKRQGALFGEADRLNLKERELLRTIARLKQAPGVRERRGGGIVVVLRSPEIRRELDDAQRKLDGLEERRAAIWREIRDIGLDLAPWEEEQRLINGVFLRQIDRVIATSKGSPTTGRRPVESIVVPFVAIT